METWGARDTGPPGNPRAGLAVRPLLWQSDSCLYRSGFNREWSTFTGCDVEALQGHGWFDLVHPADLQRLHRTVAAAAHSVMGYELAYWLRDSTGAYCQVLEQAEPAYGPGGEFRGFSGCCVPLAREDDETARRRDEDAALEQAGPAIIAVDNAGRITRWNERAYQVFGWKPAEVLGRPVQEVKAGPNQQKQAREIIAHTAAGKIWTGELATYRRDGTTFLAREIVAPVRSPRGEITGAIGLAEDVTDWYGPHNRVAHLGRLLDRSPHEIFTFDAHTFAFLEANRGARENLGYTMQELTRLTPPAIDATHTPETFRSLLAPLQSGEREHLSYESVHVRKDGTTYPVSVQLSLAHDEMPPVFVAVIEDITRRNELETRLKQAQSVKDETLRQLADERQKLEDLVQNIPGIVWEGRGQLGASDYRVTFMSSQVWDLVGYTVEAAEAASPADVFEYMHADDRDRVYRVARRIYETGEPASTRFRWITSEGHPLWIEAYMRPVKDDTANVVGLRGVNLVVDQQQRNEDLLNWAIEASRVLASSLDYEKTLQGMAHLAVPVIADWCTVHLLDDDGNLSLVSVAHTDPAKVAWMEQVQAAFDTHQPSFPPVGPANVVATGESEIAPAVTASMIERAISDPRLREVVNRLGPRSYMCVPISYRGNVMGCMTFAITDTGHSFGTRDLRAAEHLARRAGVTITNARLYERAERERARFTTIVEWLDYAVVQVDADGRIEHVNPAAEALLGLPSRELDGQVLHDLVHESMEGGCQDSRCPLVAVLRDGERRREDATFYNAQGGQVSVRLHCSPVHVAGQTLGAVIAFEDITEALMANQRKDDFLSFAAHELRNPLTPMLGLSRWLHHQVSSDPGAFDQEIIEVAATLEAESKRMANIVDVFLDLSRIESNRLTIDPAPVNLRDLVQRCVQDVQWRHPHATVRVNLPGDRCRILSDEARLQQVFANLLENAAKYGGDAPIITVTLQDMGESMRVVVHDDGPGIPLDEQHQVFKRFYRSPSNHKTKGFGVGLYLVKEIVEQLGGTITFASEPGSGTEFSVVLPRIVELDEEYA